MFNNLCGFAREEGLIFSLCTSMQENKLDCGKACLSKHFKGVYCFFLA